MTAMMIVFRQLPRLLAVCLGLLPMLAWADSLTPQLWRVTDPAGPGQAYLFGSIHFGTDELYPLPECVEQAFDASDMLVVELDLHSVDAAEAAYALQSSGRLPAGKSLRSLLSASQWQSLQTIAAQLGLPLTVLERLKPWLVAVQLTASQIRAGDYSEAYGIDRHFLSRARQQNPAKPVLELESFGQQMSLFDDLDEQQELAFLQQALSEFHRAPDALRAILEAWRAGDEEALEELVTGAFQRESDALYRRIFTDRNAAMQIRISEHLQRGASLFVVVGAGHVVGEDGLRERLRREGYRITPVCGPAAAEAADSGY